MAGTKSSGPVDKFNMLQPIRRHRWPVFEITVPLFLRPPGTLLNRLRNIDKNVYSQFKHVSSHPSVCKQKA